MDLISLSAHLELRDASQLSLHDFMVESQKCCGQPSSAIHSMENQIMQHFIKTAVASVWVREKKPSATTTAGHMK